MLVEAPDSPDAIGGLGGDDAVAVHAYSTRAAAFTDRAGNAAVATTRRLKSR